MECTPKKHKLVKRNSKISAVCLKKKTDTVSAFLTKPASKEMKTLVGAWYSKSLCNEGIKEWRKSNER